MFLAAGEVDAVVVGAVDFAGGLENVLLRHQQHALNDGTPTLSLDVGANGWQVGEGAGCIVLKRAEDAKDDAVYATIDALNISTGDLTETVNTLLDAQGVAPTDVGYLELYASGFTGEDAAEISAMLAAYGQSAEPTTAIGSVKANYGHTFAASGITSIIKTAHALHHRYIPPVPNWHTPKNVAAFAQSPFYVAPYAQPWLLEQGKTRRIAAVNGLGADGAFAHILMSDSLRRATPRRSGTPLGHKGAMQLFPIRAANETQLIAALHEFEGVFAENDAIVKLAAENFARYQQASGGYVACLVGRNSADILREIQRAYKGIPKAFAKNGIWKTPKGSYFAAQPVGGDVAFVYPGVFSSYVGLGNDFVAACARTAR